jgi:hypothetical protein
VVAAIVLATIRADDTIPGSEHRFLPVPQEPPQSRRQSSSRGLRHLQGVEVNTGAEPSWKTEDMAVGGPVIDVVDLHDGVSASFAVDRHVI